MKAPKTSKLKIIELEEVKCANECTLLILALIFSEFCDCYVENRAKCEIAFLKAPITYALFYVVRYVN